MNLNGKQIISIIGGILSVLMISTAQLTDLFGPGIAKTVVSVAGLGNLILQSVMTALTGSSYSISDVKALGQSGNADAQKAIISATADIARSAGNGIGKSAGDTLIAATIGLPQVRTIVADSATAQASPSDDVVSADQVKVIENVSGQALNH